MQFREYQTISEKNLLCLTTDFAHQPLTGALRRLREELEKHGRQQQRNIILIFPLTHNDNKVTVCIPVDHPIAEPSKDFQFTTHLQCDNAVRTRHEGKLFELKRGITHLIHYMEKQGLTPYPNAYCKVVYGLEQEPDINNIIADIYIGVG